MIRNLDGYRVAAMDFETDPFHKGRVPQPFVGGFYYPGDAELGEIYIERWGEDCAETLADAVADLDQHFLIYIHNGARFDFHFMYDLIEPPITIINSGRLVEFCLGGKLNKRPRHVVRDSLAIIPVPLDAYQKETVDYAIFEQKVRDQPHHRAAISAYLKSDCINLQSVCAKFNNRFGPRLTVGSAAIRELQKLYPLKRRFTDALDAEFRAWYFGGRVQCFAKGILKGPWQVYDVNSEFPSAMRNFAHPWGGDFETYEFPSKRPNGFYFAEIVATNRNALPMRIVETGPDGQVSRTDFDMQHGRYFVTSHELGVAERFGMIDVSEVRAVHIPHRTIDFRKFVDKFYREKRTAKRNGDRAGELFAKFMLNSCYGKFGQDPRRYKSYALLRDVFLDKKLLAEGYELEHHLRDDLEIWSKPAPLHGNSFFDVSVAASITSAARAIMLRGLQASVEPIYCDTDSVICRSFRGKIDPLTLGAWKHEATAQYAAIGGRKLYCLYNRTGGKIEPVKWASKGGDLTPYQIIKICQGETIEHVSEVPTFSLKSGAYFQSRRFRMTVDETDTFSLF